MTNAERVRNNQRRSRARRREYIAELETKLQHFESGCRQDPTEGKLAELVEELGSLKRLLHSLGLDDKFLNAYHTAAHIAPDILHTQSELPRPANDRVQAPSDFTSESLNADASQISTRQSSEHLTSFDANLPWDLFNSPTNSSSAMDSTEASDIFEPLNHRPAIETSNTTLPTSDSNTTTLCTVAFSLVLESNRKGYSATDLDLKLRAGYRFSTTPLEGCRVDNHVFMDVLAQIS
jgi:hypothetical protein